MEMTSKTEKLKAGSEDVSAVHRLFAAMQAGTGGQSASEEKMPFWSRFRRRFFSMDVVTDTLGRISIPSAVCCAVGARLLNGPVAVSPGAPGAGTLAFAAAMLAIAAHAANAAAADEESGRPKRKRWPFSSREGQGMEERMLKFAAAPPVNGMDFARFSGLALDCFRNGMPCFAEGSPADEAAKRFGALCAAGCLRSLAELHGRDPSAIRPGDLKVLRAAADVPPLELDNAAKSAIAGAMLRTCIQRAGGASVDGAALAAREWTAACASMWPRGLEGAMPVLASADAKVQRLLSSARRSSASAGPGCPWLASAAKAAGRRRREESAVRRGISERYAR